MLVTYTGLMSENAETIDWNARLLTVTQGMLVVGIVAAVLATGYSPRMTIVRHE